MRSENNSPLFRINPITSIGADMEIYDNAALPNLTGLGALTAVSGDVRINDNDALTGLSGTEALTSIGGDLEVDGNASLCDAEVDALVAQLSSFTGTISSDANEGDCLR